MKILKTHNLQKHFEGVYAVDNLSIEIEKGNITSIIGPNGSGKTTLINVLCGLHSIDGGDVSFGEDQMICKLKPCHVPKYGITRTFQDVRLFEQMTVLDNILVVLTERKVIAAIIEKHKREHLDEAESILKKIGLLEKRDKLAKNLSYGQRKLLEIGRAMAMRAEMYLLDEPFAGLFPEMAKIIVGIIQELKEDGKTVVLIEHNMDLVRQLSDYVFVMDSGKLLAKGRPDDVLKQKEVIEAYLGE